MKELKLKDLIELSNSLNKKKESLIMIELSKNIKPTQEQIKAIYEQYLIDIKPYQQMLVFRLKYRLIKRVIINPETKKSKIEYEHDGESEKIQENIRLIANFYKKHYAPYFQ